MEYVDWNNAIAKHFFRPEMEGQRVYLYVTEELIAELGQPEGAGLQEFLRAVRIGPAWATRSGLCQKALQAMQNWRTGSLAFPPYIGYLALFVLAAGIEGDFSPIAYYPRLRSLLQEPSTSGEYPSFNRMWELWVDLECWSNQDMSGRLGLFHAPCAFDTWIHTGFPVAQTLLTSTERNGLKRIFAERALDPSSPPSDEELATTTYRYGKHVLRNRTLKILEKGEGDHALRTILLDVISEELQEWDGVLEEGKGESERRLFGGLVLCCRLDRVSGRAKFTFRCKTRQELETDILDLVSSTGTQRFRCELTPGWSTVLRELPAETPVDASAFNWTTGVIFRVPEQQWSFALPPSEVRLFVEGSTAETAGLVEVRRLPTDLDFYVAGAETCRALIEKWGLEGCKEFEAIHISEGLPAGWNLYHAKAAVDDRLVRLRFPVLSLRSNVRMRFDGGIRVGRGSQFFDFAPPQLVIDGATPATEAYCNTTKVEIVRAGERSVIQAGENIRPGQNITQIFEAGQKILERRHFLVSDFPLPKTDSSRVSFDAFGNRQPQPVEDHGFVGGVISVYNVPTFNFEANFVVAAESRIFFIGSRPGQIVRWPAEPLPKTWAPIWAVPIKQHGKAIFCNARLSDAEPSDARDGERKKIKEWREVLWNWRKRITPPTHPTLRALWFRFQESARNV